ncbi:proteinase inhibitor I4 serpin [Streptomyces sp. CJ_13]|uniref:serpin family protein n=1 Tax=Streptomyces sp. CJ_13 TaxID=2724943 RepID=UPI001BDD7AD4|nr:serpin family protein [Streptomyces sp. CJ_13]MBT1186767.1 proteinase inhibitor I4 serpin [Streptomyces sp. CJ_13]
MRVTGATTRAFDEAVDAANGLTARWAERTDRGTVFSAAGVWPLLAFLADGASGEARAQLAEAVGLPAERAARVARESLVALGGLRGVDAALGLWTSRKLKVHQEWACGLPPHAHRELTGWRRSDRKALDAWAAELTGGRIPHLPVELSRGALMVLASALALKTRWIRPFTTGLASPGSGPWQGRKLAGLARTTALLDRVGVADTPAGQVTDLRVVGTNGMDVHLLLGEEQMTAGQVLKAGVGILAGRHRLVPGSRLPRGAAGPGVRVAEVPAFRPERPKLYASTVAFDIVAEHDLMAHADLFGLGSASDGSAGHFPGISDSPLAITSAKQSVMAAFTDRGFEAAVVTAVEMGEGSAPLPAKKYLKSEVYATFDRPFGFLAVHRATGLVLVAGWVTEPQPYLEVRGAW